MTDFKPQKTDQRFQGENTLKIVYQGTTSITTATGATVRTTVNHNLGFVPAGLYYINNSSQFVPLPYILGGITPHLVIIVSDVTSTSITFQADYDSNFFNATFPIKFYLLQQIASS